MPSNKTSAKPKKTLITSKKKFENKKKSSGSAPDEDKATDKEGESFETKKEKSKKVMPPKPWLMKKSLKLKRAEETENITNIDDEIKIDIVRPYAPCTKGMIR